MKYLKKFNESILDGTRNQVDKNISDTRGGLGTEYKDYKFCDQCGQKIRLVDRFCDQCGEEQETNQQSNNKQSNKNHTISGTLTKKGSDLILRSRAKLLDGTEINLEIRDKCNDCTLPIDKEVKITGTTKNGENPRFDNPIIVKSPKDISEIK